MIDPNQLYSVLQQSNLIQNLQDCLSIEAIQSVDEVQISLFNVLSLMIQLYSEGMKAVLTDAEHEVEIYLNKQFMEVNVADVLTKFSKAPYGWDNICTLYWLWKWFYRNVMIFENSLMCLYECLKQYGMEMSCYISLWIIR